MEVNRRKNMETCGRSPASLNQRAVTQRLWVVIELVDDELDELLAEGCRPHRLDPWEVGAMPEHNVKVRNGDGSGSK